MKALCHLLSSAIDRSPAMIVKIDGGYDGTLEPGPLPAAGCESCFWSVCTERRPVDLAPVLCRRGRGHFPAARPCLSLSGIYDSSVWPVGEPA